MQFSLTFWVSCNCQVFSAFGFVQKIAIFEKNGFQALIQYPGKNQLVRTQNLTDHACHVSM